jgi:hypothetical protein
MLHVINDANGCVMSNDWVAGEWKVHVEQVLMLNYNLSSLVNGFLARSFFYQ